jgi:capsular exopolysaccharide synthesis family protein
MAAGLLFTKLRKPLYQARSTVEVQGVNYDFLNMRQVDPTAPGTDLTSNESYIQTQMEVLRSESLIERVVVKLGDKFGLGDANQQPETGLLAAVRNALGLPGDRSMSTTEAVVEEVRENLTIRPARQGSIVEIRYDADDPVLAAKFVNALTDEFIDSGLRSRWQSTQRTGEWLTRQLTDLKEKVETSERDLQAYNRRAGLLYTTEKNSVAETKLGQLQDELSRAHAERVAKQTQYEMAKSAPAESLPAVLDNGPMREYQLKLAELRRQLAEQKSLLTPTNYKVVRLQAQVDDLESTAARERANITTRVQNEFRSAAAREKMLERNYAEQAALVQDQASKAIRYETLKQEVESSRAMYKETLRKVKEADVLSAIRASNIRVIDPAKPPARPYKPDMALNAGVGTFGGLLLAFMVVFVRESTDRSFRAPGNTASYLGIRDLGVVPSASGGLRGFLPRSTRLLSKGESSGDLGRPSWQRGNTPQVELIAWNQPSSQLSASFRSVMMSLLYSKQEQKPPRVMVVTSSQPKEGKTTVICNLGITLAAIGHRVVLVDGDGHEPRLHDIFGLEHVGGLGDLMSEGPFDPSALRSALQQTAIPNLLVLGAGAQLASRAPSRLFSRKLSEIVSSLRQQYDFVLIDTPPILTVPDARLFARLADGVVLVVRAEQTARDSALAAQRRLHEDGAVLLGTVLNDRKVSAVPYGRYYAS